MINLAPAIVSELPFFTLTTILVYIPFVCFSDIRTRSFEFWWYLPLFMVGTANLITYLIESPERNFYLFGLSIILCGILLGMSIIGGIGGSDFFFASFIILFMQYNPLVSPRVFFALDFFWTLLLTTATLPIIIYLYNCFEYNPPDSITGMLTHYPRGVPFMLVISFAFTATLVMEMIL